MAVDLLLADLSCRIQAVKGLSAQGGSPIPKRPARELERQGRELWNWCIRAARDAALAPKLLLQTRVFAFFCLEAGRLATSRRRPDGAAAPEAAYLLSLALTLARICIRDADTDSARLALQRAAEHVELVRAAAPRVDAPDAADASVALEVQYLMLRMALVRAPPGLPPSRPSLTPPEALKEDRIDVSEHMFNKAELLRPRLDASSAEAMADTLHHIAADLLARKDFDMALKWFKRAHDMLHAQGLDKLSMRGLDLRMAITHGRVQSLLASPSPGCLHEASDLVAYVESEMGDKPVVLHWQLEILQKSPAETFDAEAYSSVLRRMIRCFDFSDGTLDFLLHHTRHLRDKSPRLACALLDELTRQHLLQSGRAEWVDKAIVKRVWMETTQPASAEGLESLRSLLDASQDALPEPLGPAPAGAAQSVGWRRATTGSSPRLTPRMQLMWDKMESPYNKRNFAAADAWCELALHPLFARSGDTNAGKLGRRRILCAIGLNDAERARAAFQSMPDGPREEALTSYLMFKVSLLSWDHDLGRQCIEHLSRCADKARGRDMLYACVREAQQAGDKICTLAALKSVVGSCDAGNKCASNFPSVLRCTVRLMRMVEDDDDDADGHGALTGDICDAFEKGTSSGPVATVRLRTAHLALAAAEHAKQEPRDDQGNKVFTIPELHWFRKNAYNIGATNCHTWEPQHMIRIFSACVTLIGCYPSDLPLADVAELTLMAMRCHFVVAAALVSLARAQDRLDHQLQRYLEARQQVAAFDGLLQTDVGPRDADVAEDLMAKMATLFVFDFEGAVALKGWDDLGQIVRRAKMCRDEAMFKAMGDCLLRSLAPGKGMLVGGAAGLLHLWHGCSRGHDTA